MPAVERWLPIKLFLWFFIANATVLASEPLRRGVFGEPVSLEPDRSGVASELPIIMDLFEGMTTFDADGQIRPGAAESWTRSDDGLTWVFNLRPNARWSDGLPLTSEDFVYSLRRAVAPETQSTQAGRLIVIHNAEPIIRGELAPEQLGVSARGSNAIEIRLEYPFPRLPLLLAYAEAFPVPKHRVEADPEGWYQPGKLVSNGPFKLLERKPQERVTLIKNEHYYGADQVRIERVDYFPSDAVETSVSRFRAGEFHINGWPGFPPRQQAFLQRELGSAVRTSPLLLVSYFRFNLERQAFQDPRVRLALSLAIDRNAIAGRVLGGGERPALNVVPPGVTGYRGANAPDDYENGMAQRLDRARALLAQAGFSEDEPLSLTLRYPSGQGREICVAAQAMWKRLPVRTTLEQSEIKSLIADLRRGDFDMAFTGALDGDDPERFLDRLLANSSYNTGKFENAEFETLVASAKRESDIERRNELLRQAEGVVLRELPVIPLFVGVSRALVDPRVSGYVDNPVDVHLSRYLSLK